jgi:hypothetical protein
MSRDEAGFGLILGFFNLMKKAPELYIKTMSYPRTKWTCFGDLTLNALFRSSLLPSFSMLPCPVLLSGSFSYL